MILINLIKLGISRHTYKIKQTNSFSFSQTFYYTYVPKYIHTYVPHLHAQFHKELPSPFGGLSTVRLYLYSLYLYAIYLYTPPTTVR